MTMSHSFLDVTRWVLGAGLLLSNLAVWYGVYLESDNRPSADQRRGRRVLLQGLAAEAALGFFLVATDIELSSRNALLVASLSRQANQDELEILKIKSRRAVSVEQANCISTAIAKLPKVDFDVGVSIDGPEPFHFMPGLRDALIAGGWALRPWTLPARNTISQLVPMRTAVFDWTGITIFVDTQEEEYTAEVAAEVITRCGFHTDAVGKTFMPIDPSWKSFPETQPAYIHLIIGRKAVD